METYLIARKSLLKPEQTVILASFHYSTCKTLGVQMLMEVYRFSPILKASKTKKTSTKKPNPPPVMQVPWFQLKSPVNLKRSLFKKGLKDFHLIDSM